ncbi:bifunctional phosphoribosyl-AMP cyclohydrolase/phosphoribosyl-ATP diphosphatase HisIE [Campylobacter sp. FMV-PI01]|uniref:Histidine biosynthesis bifunctional protein HisIE n=1 Tax=Campylobacter portucalensis TaxID=2608384 RepID=A0A6L5WI45_9BACT|nr:bifunctional phosphoribosyl-AMP cyclohydrolase/phosphoribosyl-ATP diphosphatase HisIE [Campylobacter portucalensis]MSN95685.1 bifunctional phosphoribosyl-AMP cyclohydrolase/phosphoribosyl-ATP diphosphatase HisIE [Campylobacter portucalensis]
MKVDWQKCGGLLPVVVQDYQTNEVLMLAFMNEEALNLSLFTKFAHYFSRTKNRIWKKGQESGNFQKIEKIYLDCDNDTLLLKVKQKGVACHTGAKSCFFKEINLDGKFKKPTQNKTLKIYDTIDEIYHIIQYKKLNASPQNSYVANLISRGENAMLKKICEEAAEFVLACKDLTKFNKYAKFNIEKFGEHIDGNPKFDVVYEASDLIFHLLVALATHNIHPSQIINELARRNGLSGIDEKKSRKK